jgi:5-methyltetrahydrofolate--homocysteine methyltransferase
MTTTLSAPNGEIQFGPGLPTALINDQLRIMDQSPTIFEQLREGILDGLLELARWGQEIGTDLVDILVFHPDLDEVDLLPRVAARVKDEVGCPISLDSRNPQALEAALGALRPYNAMINSVTAENDSLNMILPIAKKYGAVVVGMPIGHFRGIPKKSGERLSEARVIVEACEGIGIPRENVVMDAICLASSVDPDSFQVTMETLRLFHGELGVSTTLGIGNAGHGMPEQTVIDLAYLVGGIPWGLDSALVNPATRGLVETVRAMDFLAGKDPAGRRYIQNYRKHKKAAKFIDEQ